MNQYLEKIAAWHPDIFNKGSASQVAQAKDSLRLIGDWARRGRQGYGPLDLARHSQSMSDMHRSNASKWMDNAKRDFKTGSMLGDENDYVRDTYRGFVRGSLRRAKKETEIARGHLGEAKESKSRALALSPGLPSKELDLRSRG